MNKMLDKVIEKLEADRDNVVAAYGQLIALLRSAPDDLETAAEKLDRAADAEFDLAGEVEHVEEFASMLGFETSDDSEPPGRYRRKA